MKNNGTVALVLRFMRGSMGFFGVTFLLLIGDMASHVLPPFFQQVFTDNIWSFTVAHALITIGAGV